MSTERPNKNNQGLAGLSSSTGCKSFQFCLISAPLAPEHKIDRAQKAGARPNVISLEWFAHIKHSEGHEDTERNNFLRNLELSN
jgi:hypothetical protein